MRLPACGGLCIIILAAVAGCAAPLTQRQAQGYSQASLRRYCNPAAPCHFVKAQHMPTGWLLDYESATALYGVKVEENGGTTVSVWAKDVSSPR